MPTVDLPVPFSRQDPRYARSVIEKLIPVLEQRRAFLELLASLIEDANEKPQNWGVTLHSREVALNVGGGYYSIWLSPGNLKLFWLGQAPDEPAVAALAFRSIPDSRSAWNTPEVALSWAPALRKHMSDLIRYTNAKSSVLQGNSRKAHSPGVLRYLEGELDVKLPDPIYPTIAEERPRRYWRVGTREGSERIDRWPSMLAGGFISVGWHELGDLNILLAGLFDADAATRLREFFLRRTANASTATHYTRQWHDFYATMQEGDIVAAMNGQSLLGIGSISGDYLFDETDELQPHHRPVNWAWTGEKVWKNYPVHLTTVTDFTGNVGAVRFIDRLLDGTGNVSNTEPSLPDAGPLNTILYGPPGTGKTYETARRAVEIIDGTVADDRVEIMKRYKSLQKEGRIAFVTFHQSYSYEDFVEGIRPVMDDDDDVGGVRYRIVDGILKGTAMHALGAYLRPVDGQHPSVTPFSSLWQAFIEKIEADPDKPLPGLANSAYRLRVTPRGNLQGINVNGKAAEPYNASRKKIEAVWNRLAPTQRPTHKALMEILEVGAHTNLIGAVIEDLRRLADELPDEAPSSEPAAPDKAREFLSRNDASGYALTEHGDRFVLIVDEINRGNISKILGELITLLEDDKRLGRLNELIVTLPYSREPFALPPNLFIIGTMNTADKSLALVDVALRRRFAFRELSPNFDFCQPDLAAPMREVLNELNHRIVLRKDRDHRIGHAFFMGVGDDETRFDAVFESRIVPLLQEYFFNDWDGLRFVLGEDETQQGFVRPLGAGNDTSTRNRWKWYTDDGDTVRCLRRLGQNYRMESGDGTHQA